MPIAGSSTAWSQIVNGNLALSLGLVLASVALADRPRVMLPIILYNLVQHLAAGSVAYLLRGPAADPASTPLAGPEMAAADRRENAFPPEEPGRGSRVVGDNLR